MLNIQRFVFNPFSENTFLVWDQATNETAAIDPGCFFQDEEETISAFIGENGLKLKYLINTHGHIDHIIGNRYIKQKYNPLFLAPEKDMPLIESLVETGQMYGVAVKPSPLPDDYITEETIIRLGEISGRFLYTPGHTLGEFSLYFEEEKVCFTGDVLFKENIGRTDLSGGNYEILIQSIKRKLLSLPDDVVIHPGHNSRSTIGFEKKRNPFFS
jgi:hydroxyacylglutathione hydrolase